MPTPPPPPIHFLCPCQLYLTVDEKWISLSTTDREKKSLEIIQNVHAGWFHKKGEIHI